MGFFNCRSPETAKLIPSGIFHLFDILLWQMILCLLDLKRQIPLIRFLRCFWLTPEFTLFLQSLKLDSLSSVRISSITSDSLVPNWNVMASKGVRSSQAISMIRSISRLFNSLFFIRYFISSRIYLGRRRFSIFIFTASLAAIFHFVPVFLPFFPPVERQSADFAGFRR